MKKKLKFEVVTNDDRSTSVKTQIRKNGKWYTVADTFCVPGYGNANEVATTIAAALNLSEAMEHYENP